MTAEQWATIRYFRGKEFDSHDAPGSGAAAMKFEFVSLLDQLRSAWGAPLRVMSGFRTTARNAAVGGEPNSSHLRGLGADLATADIRAAIKLAIVASRIGFARIGVDLKGRLVHVDADPSLPQNVVWFYEERGLA